MENVAVVLISLGPTDFDPKRVEARGIETLAEVGTAIEAHRNPRELFSAVFQFMERLDSCELGTPGPLVHALEAIGGYNTELVASLMRKPTPLTVLMLNRILNAPSSTESRSKYLKLLARSATHPAASPEAKSEAARLLAYQHGRG